MILHNHCFRSIQAVGLALSVLLPTLGMSPLIANVLAKESQQTTKISEEVDSFIVERVGDVSTCREATPAEVSSLRRRPDDIGVPVEFLISNKQNPSPDNAGGGLTINLVALSQLQSDPNKATVIAAVQQAAAVWTARIKSPVTISLDIDYGPNFPDGTAFPNGVLASTVSRRTLIDYPGARTNLIAGASSANESAIYNQLPTSFLPTDIGNGTVIGVNRSVAFALGIPVTSPSDPNVATIGFNKSFPYDFNPNDGISPGLTDFISVATHEIGHALGFVSGAGNGDTSTVRLWDLFRFRPGTTTGTFTVAQRVMALGGQQVYFTGESFLVENLPTNELALSTGGPGGTTNGGGDGRQSSHWKDDFFGQYIGIMDPSIATGVHETTRETDFMAMEMLGWNLINSVAPPPAPPPPPPPANDNFANAQIVSGCSGSVNGVNLAATHEPGEPQHFPSSGPGALGGGNRSVWYFWQAPGNVSVEFTTAGSRYDTVLAIYSGTAVGSLNGTLVGQSDDDASNRTSKVTFAAQAGKIYKIAVDGYNNEDSGGDTGPITLNWTALTTCSVPGAAPQILLEQSGPVADQAAVFESILHLRDPFRVVNSANLFNPVSDPNTNVVIFVANLPSSAVTVNLIDSNNNTFDITPVDVHEFTDLQFSQVTFRLPTGLAPGTCRVKMFAQSLVSNTATFRIL